MLTIRKEQLDLIQSARTGQYHHKLAALLRETVPDLLVGVTDASLLNLVAGQVQRAHTWGIDTPEGVIQFIALGVLVSPTFDEHPAVRRFLNAPDLDPDFKISVLSQLTTKKLRELSQ